MRLLLKFRHSYVTFEGTRFPAPCSSDYFLRKAVVCSLGCSTDSKRMRIVPEQSTLTVFKDFLRTAENW